MAPVRPAPGGYAWRDSSGKTRPGYAYDPVRGLWVKVSDLPGPSPRGGATHGRWYRNRNAPHRMPKNIPTATDPNNTAGRLARAEGAVDVKTPVGSIGSLDVKGMQRFLRHKGYDIQVDGKLGPVTKAALADFMEPQHVGDKLAIAMKGTRFTGARDPKAFNAKFGNHPVKAFKPATGKGGLLDSSGNVVNQPGASGDQGGGTIDSSGADLSDANAFVPIPENWANGGAQLLDPKYADAIAGLQFDAQIHDLAAQIARNPAQAAQAQHDIESWYGQALGSAGTARTRDKAASDAGAASMDNATQALVASLGGSANEGSGTVGAAGVEASGTLRALGTAEDQYNNDLVPILNLEKSGAHSAETARSNEAAQNLALQMADLKGQRGQAKTASLLDIAERNNAVRDSRLGRQIDIRQANNTLSQQRFQNNLAREQAGIAATVAGAKLVTAGRPKPAKGAFGNTGANIHNNAFNQAVSAIYDPQAGKLTTSVPGAVARVNATLRGFGWSLSNPEVLKFRNNVLSSVGIKPDPRWR